VRAIGTMRYLISFARETSRSTRARHIHRNETFRSAAPNVAPSCCPAHSQLGRELNAVLQHGLVKYTSVFIRMSREPPSILEMRTRGGAFHGFRVEAPKLVRTAPKTR
jgi:hypothetical protein